MITAVGTWGNSAAVRIPRAMLSLLRLRRGDEVEIGVNERGNIEIAPAARAHRRVEPTPGVTFESLFADYGGGRHDSSPAWADEGMVGAEAGAWS